MSVNDVRVCVFVARIALCAAERACLQCAHYLLHTLQHNLCIPIGFDGVYSILKNLSIYIYPSIYLWRKYFPFLFGFVISIAHSL